MKEIKSYKSEDGRLYETKTRAVAADVKHKVGRIANDDDIMSLDAAIHIALNHRIFIKLLEQLNEKE